MKLNLLGVDTGGTFTDFVHFDGRAVRTQKVLSTPEAPERAILQGVADLGLTLEGLRVIHGSTIATNAALERKGVNTLYITNRGFADILSIGRQARRELYNLQPQPVPPPVSPEYCLETGGRLSATGEVLEELTADDLEDVRRVVTRLQPEAVAINLLFSFLDDRFEQQLARVMPADVFVSLSSQVLPEYGEYERGITTWLNAYIGPRVQGYLARLGQGLHPASIAVMRSSGDTCSADQAGREAVHLLLSGPAGGLDGACFIGELAGESRILTLDMGGTSTDVALIDGDIRLTGNGHMGPYPVGVPMVDMHTIGAGGGSIAYVDAGGALQVGPESAGARPGPACYGAGGEQPTVTDANLVLGYMPGGAVLGGGLKLQPERAGQALAGLARELGLGSAEAAALGVIRLANEHMAQALRVISVQKGIDPREFSLFAFGGAGGMHVCALADMLGITRGMVPIQAGVLSALGMLVAPAGRQLSRTLGMLLEQLDEHQLDREFGELLRSGMRALRAEGIDPEEVAAEPALDLCYRGQSTALTLTRGEPGGLLERFHRAHEQRYGHRLEAPVEVVNVRLGLRTAARKLALPRMTARSLSAARQVRVYGVGGPVPLYRREDLPPGRVLDGPLQVIDAMATTWVPAEWKLHLDDYGNLLLQRA